MRLFADRQPLLVLAFGLCACRGQERHVIGFPPRDLDDPAAASLAVLADAIRIEETIAAGRSREDGEPGAATAPAAAGEDQAVLDAIFTAQLATGNEDIDYRDPPQNAFPGRLPLQLFPRLTSPAIVDVRDVAVPAPDGRASTARKWYVPIIFNREALSWEDSFRTTWLGWRRWSAQERPEELVSIWLELHGDRPAEERQAIRVDDFLVRPANLDVPLATGGVYSLPDVDVRRGACALALPVAAGGAGAGGAGFRPGFYDVRFYPKIPGPELAGPCARTLAARLERGDWYRILDDIREAAHVHSPGELAALRADVGALAEAVAAYPPTYFRPELEGLEDALARFAAGKAGAAAPGEPSAPCGRAMVEIEQAVRRLLEIAPHPAPVLLEPQDERGEAFTFVAAADFQCGGDMTLVRRFLRMIDPSLLPAVGDGDPHYPLLPRDLRERLEAAKFVIVAGDVADGGGYSSSSGRMTLNSLGLLPPSSTYTHGEEFPNLVEELRRFRKPLFAVPGNHDGYASFGGLFNNALNYVARGFKAVLPPPWSAVTHPIGEAVDRLARSLPILIKVSRFGRFPFYDGLVEWQYYLGPLNVAFTFRGHSFVGINSYNLPVSHRDSIGALTFNWGGGVQRKDVVWIDFILRWLARRTSSDPATAGRGHQFIFLHHDPRGSMPSRSHQSERNYGLYDSADTWLNALTFGYLGILHSPNNPLFLPLVTSVTNFIPHMLFYGEMFEQEWMGPDWIVDGHNKNAQHLIGAINSRLAASGAGDPRLSCIFFGHDNEPLISRWVHDDSGGAVFPPPDHGRWTGSTWGALAPLVPIVRVRNVEPPEWARRMVFTDGRNAAVVRLDDVGETGSVGHGFSLVTVWPAGPDGAAPKFSVEWIPIPQP